MHDRPPLAVAQLTKRYGDLTALHDVSLTAAAGQVTALLGHNGAGKTTLIGCCTGLITACSGQVTVLGQPAARTAATRAAVGVMLQDGGLPTTSTPTAFLQHLSRLHTTPRPVAELIERLGLTDHASTSIRRLSGGQRQRVAFAAAIIGRPHVAFLDEPTAGMDERSRTDVYDLIAELTGNGCAVVLTTHNMPEAAALADHVVVLNHGQVAAAGTPEHVTSALGTERTHIVTSGPLPAAGLAAALHHNRTITATDSHLTLSGHLSTAELHAVTGLAVASDVEILDISFVRATLADAVTTMTTPRTAPLPAEATWR